MLLFCDLLIFLYIYYLKLDFNVKAIKYASNVIIIDFLIIDLLERWQKIENLALNKESRVTENRKSWENFSKELKGFEAWIQKTLQDYSPATCTDADIEKLTHLLQRHKVHSVTLTHASHYNTLISYVFGNLYFFEI